MLKIDRLTLMSCDHLLSIHVPCRMLSSVLLESRELRTLSQSLAGKSESEDSLGNFIH